MIYHEGVLLVNPILCSKCDFVLMSTYSSRFGDSCAIISLNRLLTLFLVFCYYCLFYYQALISAPSSSPGILRFVHLNVSLLSDPILPHVEWQPSRKQIAKNADENVGERGTFIHH